jgi:NAD(P)-dependent dehydrogenase (short-subunit alcohol dehydrogenase family)
VRDPKSATDALEKVLERSPGGVKVDLWQLDLADFASVKAFAKQCESLGNVDVVLNNAA